ncbi:MAG: hypothetical protein KDK23_12130 [Leptospiraceae bacterium]|nr:hypothetical protein [Leptospiraceae bacterium]
MVENNHFCIRDGSRDSRFTKRLVVTLALAALLAAISPLLADSRTIGMEELKKHSTASSCWIAIDGVVYDITDYLAEHAHQHQFSLDPFCGTNATSGWNNKNNTGKSHSRKASIQLERYRLGTLKSAD